MYLTIDQLQLVRLLCDLSLCKLEAPEKEQVEAMLFSVEVFLFNLEPKE